MTVLFLRNSNYYHSSFSGLALIVKYLNLVKVNALIFKLDVETINLLRLIWQKNLKSRCIGPPQIQAQANQDGDSDRGFVVVERH